MLKRLGSVCVRSAGHSQKRFRGKSSSKGKQRPNKWAQSKKPDFFSSYPRSPFVGPSLVQARAAPPDHLTPETASKYFEAHVLLWAKDPRTLARYQNFGFRPDDIAPALAAFAEAGSSGFFSTSDNQLKYQLARFSEKPSVAVPKWAPVTRQFEAEITFSNIFFAWCRHLSDSSVLDDLVLKGKLKSQILGTLRHLAEVAFRRPAEEFPFTRRMQRKVIMHVGPTNSGKTHHALRALAAAKTGVYAGPLRLLAHEIWERLNLGQIVPLGVEQPPPNVNGHPSSHPTSPSPDQVSALHSPAKESPPTSHSIYARATNMLTGEEQKIVDHQAGLLSCTVEMLSSRMEYDVGVIDEIQMIGDPERGFAWTAAVLGLSAKELHLCGEASAIPIIKSLLAETGDELEIRMYERLTPLLVEDQSLGGDLSKIQKGDCVVAFSRNRIFAIKNEIEQKSGLKCAVVYGKLPPEIRSEQAALFNDPNSGFDVIIGSDAIGMGLNLKIRRIIFSAVSKADGATQTKVPLSISQTKQIAGRAGRYGHSIDSSNPPGGYVTTLFEKDLPFVKDALSRSSTPTLTHAYVGPTTDSIDAFCSALPILASSRPHDSSSLSTSVPRNSFLESIQMAHLYVSSLPPAYKYINTSSPNALTKLSRICSWIEEHSKGVMTWAEKMCWMHSPVAWRDDLCMKCFEVMIRRQREDMNVGDIKAVLEETSSLVNNLDDRDSKSRGFIQVLEWTEEQMRMYNESHEALLLSEREGKKKLESSESQQKEGESSSEVLDAEPQLFVPQITSSTLEVLESFHKILVFYMWMLFRNSVIFSDQTTTEELKKRVEVALDWALQVMTQDKAEETKKGKVTREEKWFNEREALKQLMQDYEKRNVKEKKREEREMEKSVWSEEDVVVGEEDIPKAREEDVKRMAIGILDSADIKAKSKRAWVQAPDLTTLLKNYVDNPGLRVGRRR